MLSPPASPVSHSSPHSSKNFVSMTTARITSHQIRRHLVAAKFQQVIFFTSKMIDSRTIPTNYINQLYGRLNLDVVVQIEIAVIITIRRSSVRFNFPDCVRNNTLAKEAANAVAEVYADECRSRGHSQPQWRDDYQAVLTCPAGEQYSYTGPRCPEVCGLDTSRCAEQDVEGCVCASGTTREANTCVNPSQCGCSDRVTGIYYQVINVCSNPNPLISLALQCYSYSNHTINFREIRVYKSCEC